MRTVTNRAETIERGNAAGGGEVAIGTTANGAFVDREVHLRSERFGPAEQSGAHLAFERRAIEAAANFETRSGKCGAKCVEVTLQALHVGDP